MAKFRRTFVLLRPAAVAAARRTNLKLAAQPQHVQGYEVRDDVGESGGIVLNEVTMADHPNYPVTGEDGKKTWEPRNVIRSERQWTPTACLNCGIAFDEVYIDPQADKPKRHVCAECHRPIIWDSRRLFICEPVRWDVERILASVSTDPPWTWVEVRSPEQLAMYTGGEPEAADWTDVDKGDEAEAIVARAVAGATQKRDNVPSEYRALQKEIDRLGKLGAPIKDLSRGKISPKAELAAFIDTHEARYVEGDEAATAEA